MNAVKMSQLIAKDLNWKPQMNTGKRDIRLHLSLSASTKVINYSSIADADIFTLVNLELWALIAISSKIADSDERQKHLPLVI